MSFRRTPGRPRRSVSAHAATPELLLRHGQGITRAPLDALLAEGVIEAGQHAAGMRLRFLRAVTLGVGVPQAGFYWMPSARGEVQERDRESWAREYATLRQALTMERLWSSLTPWCFEIERDARDVMELSECQRRTLYQQFLRLEAHACKNAMRKEVHSMVNERLKL